MNSLYENRNIDPTAEKRLEPFRCPECGWVANHTEYPKCVYRDEYKATGNPYLWPTFKGNVR